MYKFFIKDGNLKEWVRIFFVVSGIIVVVLGILIDIKSVLGFTFFIAGFILAAVGGYAAQAHVLKIKPFDNAHKKSRESYRKIDEED